MKNCMRQYLVQGIVDLWFFFQGIYYNFELFRIREKQIPVDKVECKGKVYFEPSVYFLVFVFMDSFVAIYFHRLQNWTIQEQCTV